MAWRWEPNRAEIHKVAYEAAVEDIKHTATMVEVMSHVRLAAHTKYASGVSLATLGTHGPYDEGDGVVSMQVGSEGDGAAFLQSGAKRHKIFPRGPYRLKFFWDKVGRVVYPASVKHPGMKKDPWLTSSLATVARMRGYKVQWRSKV